jgi:hypothetical protein
VRALIVIALMTGVAGACPQTGYVVGSGSLSAGARCGEHIIATTATGPDRAVAAVTIKRHVKDDFDLSLKWRALTAQPVTLQILVPGGYLLVKDGGIGLYTTEAAWSEHGFTPVAHMRVTDVMPLHVRQRGVVLTAAIGETVVGTWQLPARPPGDLQVGVVGPANEHSRIWIADIFSR